jgi:copper chaperone NosL
MILGVAAVLMLFLFPMWRITLYAPQYPQGVTMYIWINKIDGEEAGTIQNINILNHYVGMKYIEPDSIPELVYFPWIILAVAGLGLLAALWNNRWGYLSWFVLFAALAALGLYDFYLWEYDYGHNLSDTAPIKIPGASFQPPLLGTKDILNFVAESYPHTGGYFAGIGSLLALAAFWFRSKFVRS